MMSNLYVVFALCCLWNVAISQSQIPQQIHLSYGRDPTSMMVTWSTTMRSNFPVCYYKMDTKPYSLYKATGYVSEFKVGHVQYIHRVLMDKLRPGTKYIYQCGDFYSHEYSDIYSFTSMRAGTNWSPKLAVYGDLGVTNDMSIPLLKEDIIKGMYDAVLHVGDFAYNMETDQGYLGDTFMNLIQPMASQVPYMTCPGNHEAYLNFTNYKNRFTMPRDESSQNMFYSFDIGPAHIISFSSEHYFFWYLGMGQMIRQFEWLEKDLKEADKNRDKRPWIITMAHRPMYCSNHDRDDCTYVGSIIRNGFSLGNQTFLGLEKLFFKYGVDLSIWAHEHSYERLWPIYNEVVRNGSYKEPYKNPDGPVHIISGSAGCYGKHDHFKNASLVKAWSAFRIEDYGYSRMHILNSSHLRLQEVSIDKGGKVVDDIWIVKDKHGPYEDKFPKERKLLKFKDQFEFMKFQKQFSEL